MPFNERGEWVVRDPLCTYIQTVQKSEQNPGSGGALWTERERHRLHNNATFFVMQREGIPYDEVSFKVVRDFIGRMVDTYFECDEKNGYLEKLTLSREQPLAPYKIVGD